MPLTPAQEADLGVRMRLVSEPLVGADYVLNPAGEGQEPDLDPIARYDALDCLTLVEEVYALASGQTLDEINRTRQLLRYGNESDPLSLKIGITSWHLSGFRPF